MLPVEQQQLPESLSLLHTSISVAGARLCAGDPKAADRGNHFAGANGVGRPGTHKVAPDMRTQQESDRSCTEMGTIVSSAPSTLVPPTQ